MIGEAERLRYARQMPIPGWGEAGQARLQGARGVVAGAGGLGAAVLTCLYRDTAPGEVPVAGVAPAVVGSLQAAEVIELLPGLGELLRGRMLVYDGLDARFRELRLKRDPHCPLCGSRSPAP